MMVLNAPLRLTPNAILIVDLFTVRDSSVYLFSSPRTVNGKKRRRATKGSEPAKVISKDERYEKVHTMWIYTRTYIYIIFPSIVERYVTQRIVNISHGSISG